MKLSILTVAEENVDQLNDIYDSILLWRFPMLSKQGHGFAGQGREDSKKMAEEFFCRSI